MESDTAVKTAVDLNIDKAELDRIKNEEQKINIDNTVKPVEQVTIQING